MSCCLQQTPSATQKIFYGILSDLLYNGALERSWLLFGLETDLIIYSCIYISTTSLSAGGNQKNIMSKEVDGSNNSKKATTTANQSATSIDEDYDDEYDNYDSYDDFGLTGAGGGGGGGGSSGGKRMQKREKRGGSNQGSTSIYSAKHTRLREARKSSGATSKKENK